MFFSMYLLAQNRSREPDLTLRAPLVRSWTPDSNTSFQLNTGA